MRKVSNVIWGIVLVAVGVFIALNAMGVINVDIFFDGWWTVFIIIPCGIGLVTEREKTGNLIGLICGVFLLLCCLDVLSFSLLWKLLVPAIVVIIGLKLIFNAIFGSKANEIIVKMKSEGNAPKTCCAVFSGNEVNYCEEPFEGAELVAVFGGVDCNLKSAVIGGDCAITAAAVFGGIDIIVPANVNVKVNSTSIFGGVSNETASYPDAPTIYIKATCLFGGVDIK